MTFLPVRLFVFLTSFMSFVAVEDRCSSGDAPRAFNSEYRKTSFIIQLLGLGKPFSFPFMTVLSSFLSFISQGPNILASDHSGCCY